MQLQTGTTHLCRKGFSVNVRLCVDYQVSSSGQRKQSQTEVKFLLDDQMTKEWSQQNPTHTQQVGDCPWILILKKKNK